MENGFGQQGKKHAMAAKMFAPFYESPTNLKNPQYNSAIKPVERKYSSAMGNYKHHITPKYVHRPRDSISTIEDGSFSIMPRRKNSSLI